MYNTYKFGCVNPVVGAKQLVLIRYLAQLWRDGLYSQIAWRDRAWPCCACFKLGLQCINTTSQLCNLPLELIRVGALLTIRIPRRRKGRNMRPCFLGRRVRRWQTNGVRSVNTLRGRTGFSARAARHLLVTAYFARAAGVATLGRAAAPLHCMVVGRLRFHFCSISTS